MIPTSWRHTSGTVAPSLVTFPASVNRTSRTSMEIGVRVATQDLVSQVVRHTNSGYFTVVAVGPVGDRLRSRRGSRPPPKKCWRSWPKTTTACRKC